MANPSFETPTVGAGSFTVFPVGGSPTIPSWTVVGPATTGDSSDDNSNGLDTIALIDLGVIGGAVPEPTSAVLVVSGLLGLGLLSRRKRST